MPEAVPATPEVPPEVKERQETDAYIAEREKQKNAPPPPVVIETTKPATPEELAASIPEPLKGKSAAEIKAVLDNAIPPESIDRQAVDAYISEREKSKRRERGGKQVKIEQLTKEKHELEEKAAALEKEKAELAAKAVTEPPKPAAIEPPKPAEQPKASPKMSDYTDVDKYNADMALWAASQVKSAAPEPPKPAVQEPPKPDPLRKEEFDRFLEKGKALMVKFPDFNTTLEAAHVRGLTMSEQARVAITRLAAPEVAYWLAKPENDLAAREFMKLDDFQQVIEIGKIAERLTVKPSDFVSSAPPPGLRVGGNVQPALALNEIQDTDEYIRQRRQQKRAGMRGR